MSYTQPRKPRVRVFSWVILAINVLFLIWVIAGIASASGDATDCGSLSQQTCNDASDTGTAIGVFLIVVFWAAVDIILGIIWLVTRPRPAPIYQAGPAYGPPPPSWYPDPAGNPTILRWFDGRQFTPHTRPR